MTDRFSSRIDDARAAMFALGRLVSRVTPVSVKNKVARMPAFSSPARTWVMPDHGIAYVEIPKVATRSVRAALAALALGESVVDMDRATRWVTAAEKQHLRTLYPTEIRSLNRTLFTFGFVRDPLDRLRSAYANKSMASDEGAKMLFRRLALTMDASFADFVGAVAATSDDDCDPHVRSQHRFVADRRGVVVQHVGRLEQLEEEWTALRESVGSLPALPRRNVSSSGDIAFTVETAQLAVKRYERDIDLFGYRSMIARHTERRLQ